MPSVSINLSGCIGEIFKRAGDKKRRGRLFGDVRESRLRALEPEAEGEKRGRDFLFKAEVSPKRFKGLIGSN